MEKEIHGIHGFWFIPLEAFAFGSFGQIMTSKITQGNTWGKELIVKLIDGNIMMNKYGYEKEEIE